MTGTRAADLAPGDTYTVGGDTLTVTAPPYTTTGPFGPVLRIPIRQGDGTDTVDVVHTDHSVNRT